MTQERPDVVAFNGYADQYAEHPIAVHQGERIRVYLLNPGPTHVSSFHVIGAVFDTTRSEGVTGGPAQSLALAPSTGGSVDFTLAQPGAYPFVDHNFASMEKGAMGILSADVPDRNGDWRSVGRRTAWRRAPLRRRWELRGSGLVLRLSDVLTRGFDGRQLGDERVDDSCVERWVRAATELFECLLTVRRAAVGRSVVLARKQSQTKMMRLARGISAFWSASG